MKVKKVILEKGETSCGAYVPDLSGCVAVGETENETLKGAIEFHIEGLREDNVPIPFPHSAVNFVEVAV